VTRIHDGLHRQQLGTREIRFGIWLARVRRFGALAAWLLIMLIIMAVVVLGVRPAPTDFDSLSPFVT
jgi:hypothetical protein